MGSNWTNQPGILNLRPIMHRVSRSTSVVSQNYADVCQRKRQRTAALQDADALSHAQKTAKRLGVRLSSAAFQPAGKVQVILRRHTRRLLASFCLTLLLYAAGLSSGAAETVLEIEGTRFVVNDKPRFLLGLSYYGGLGAAEDLARKDLEDAQRYGFNWLRVWATWGAFSNDVSAVSTDGRPRQPYLERLKRLVAECDRRGLVLDITLTRGKVSRSSPGGGWVADLASHQRAVETLVGALKPWRNWYLDLANEHDVRDARFVPARELKTLRELVRRLDPGRLVTCSFGGHDLKEEELRENLIGIGLDFLTPHRPRTAESPRQTEAQTRKILAAMDRLGHPAPVHYQEPFRRGYGRWQPTAEDFLTDLRGAIAGGAAGWCFHNGAQNKAPDSQPRRSFDLRDKRLFDQLDREELRLVRGVGKVVAERNKIPDHKPKDASRLSP